MKYKNIILTAGAIAASVTSSHAATMALYDFNVDFTATTPTAGVTASDVTAGAGINLVIDTGGNAFNDGTVSSSLGGAQTVLGFTDMGNNDNLALAITNDDYYAFSITSGGGIDYDTVDFQFRINSANNSAERYAIFSSVGGFVSDTDAIATGQQTTAGAFSLVSLDISALTGAAGTTDFRLYIYGGNNNGSSATVIDELTITGTAIPEPSSSLLVGLAGLGFILRRRR